MAENGNRGPNEAFRRQPSRKRREPPIIDAQAAEVPAEANAFAERSEADRAGVDARALESEGADRTHAEPVLFGAAARESSTTSEQPAGASGDEKTRDFVMGPTADLDPELSSAPEPADPTRVAAALNEPEPAAIAESPRPSRPSRWSAASVLLTLVVLALLASIAGLLYTEPQRSRSREFSASLAALDARMTALEARPAGDKADADIAAVGDRAGALESQLASLKASLAEFGTRLNAVAAEASATSSRLSALSETTSPPAASIAAVQPADLAALGSRIDELARSVAAVQEQSQTAASRPNGADDAVDGQIAALDRRLGGLDQRVESIGTVLAAQPKVDLDPIQSRVAALDGRVVNLDHQIEALGGKIAALPKVDLAPVQAALGQVEQRLTPLEAALLAPKTGERVTEARSVGSADEARAAPLAVLAQAVNQALSEGRPFATEVAALRALGVDDASLAPLAPVAERGGTTFNVLKDRWTDVAGDVVAADRPQQSGGVLDRLAAGARGLVEVRRLDAPPEQASGSASGRIGAALDRGDLAGALAEWDKLPEAGQRASQGWADEARALLAAQAAAQHVLSGAIATLAKAKD